MPRPRKGLNWVPLWVDKWLLGSTRFELEPAERAVFIDLLCLAAKENGYVRANEEMGYPPQFLANMLNVPLELMQRTIEKCERCGKVERLANNILKITAWEKYALSERHIRRIEKETDTKTDTMSAKTDIMSENTDTMSEKADTKKREYNIREENIREEKRREEKRINARTRARAKNALTRLPPAPQKSGAANAASSPDAAPRGTQRPRAHESPPSHLLKSGNGFVSDGLEECRAAFRKGGRERLLKTVKKLFKRFYSDWEPLLQETNEELLSEVLFRKDMLLFGQVITTLRKEIETRRSAPPSPEEKEEEEEIPF